MIHQHRNGGEVIHGDVKKPLDLPGVQVNGHHPIGPRHGEHVRQQFGSDGLASSRLTVLAGVPIERHHGGDAFG